MPTLLLAFANSDLPTERLHTLTAEYEGVSSALRDRAGQQDFILVPNPIAKKIPFTEDLRAHEQDICLFLFSGHAGLDRLNFEDGPGYASGLSELLKKSKNLKVVILNGCSTVGQVNSLIKLGIPIVIATSSPVGDQTATQFSITLFKELSQQKVSIKEAFERAIATAKYTAGQLPIHSFTSETDQINVDGRDEKLIHYVESARGLGIGENEQDRDKPLWGLYCQEKDRNLLESWRLPTKFRNIGGSEGKINLEITNALEQIAENYSVPPTDNVLHRLPYVIHLPLRKLLASESSESFPFYDSPSWERFQMLLYAYRAIINLTTYTLLALTWDRLVRNPTSIQFPEDCLDLIKDTLFTVNNSDKKRSNLVLLKRLGLILTADQQDQFLGQFATLLSELEESEYRWALEDLESKVKNQDYYQPYFPNSKDPDALAFCLEAEHSLAVIMVLFGFWVDYSLTSIKDVGFLKFHRLKERTYMHRIVALQYPPASIKSDDDQYSIPTPLETTSIILHPYGKWSSGGLNLSPFLIDRNALLRVPKADLHYLLSYSPHGKGAFCYRKVNSFEGSWDFPSTEKPKSVLPTKEAKEEAIYHTLLKRQLGAFAQTVLNKKLNEL